MATWQAEYRGDRLRVRRDGHSRWLVTQHAEPDQRPYLHPLLTPSEAEPFTEDRPPHHPWQHGLYVGLNQVNGIGFWTEQATDGTFHPAPLQAPQVADAQASWVVECRWDAPDGAVLLDERQAWTLTGGDGSYALDLAWTLTARTELTFGQYAYGGLFIRMPYDAARGASALNSDGMVDQAGEGERARWVAVTMPLPETGATVTVAMFDHPDNPDHPVPWRIDGQFGIAPSRCIAGRWALAAGEATTSRYRVVAMDGDLDAARVEADWQGWAGGR